MLSSNLLFFDLSLKEALLKHYTAKWKMISENIITDTVKKNLQEDCLLPKVSNFQ